MLHLIRKHTGTIAVAMITAMVTAGAPAIARTIADYARNADKVDGRHAVGAGASIVNRAGKLVATNKQGYLPNSIIRKATDADALDGIDSTGFYASGSTVADSNTLDGIDSTGFYTAGSTVADSNMLDGLDSTEIGATEIQIHLVTGRLENEANAMQNCGGDESYRLLPNTGCPVSSDEAKAWSALVDPSDYPTQATVQLEVAMMIQPSRTACARLFDLTDGQPVAGSEICVPNASASKVGVRTRSGTFSLNVGLHEYGIEVKPMPGNISPGAFMDGRMIIDW